MSDDATRRPTLRELLRRAAKGGLTEHASPARIGVAVALGVWIACTPFYGLQTLLALGIAWMLRLNRLVTVAASQISIPPVSPLLVVAAVQTGEILLHGRLLAQRFGDFNASSAIAWARFLFVSWLLGGCVMGIVLGAAFGFGTYVLLSLSRGGKRREACDAERSHGP